MSLRSIFVSLLGLLFQSSLQGQDTLIPASGHDVWDDGIVSKTSWETTASINVEAGGNGGIYSFNFQRHIPNPLKQSFNFSAGLSVFPRGPLLTMSIPVSVNYNLHIKPRKIVVMGTGQTLILSNTKGGYLRGSFRFGYRQIFLKERAWYLEAAYTPFYSYLYNFQWDHWLGVSFGYYLNSKKREVQ